MDMTLILFGIGVVSFPILTVVMPIRFAFALWMLIYPPNDIKINRKRLAVYVLIQATVLATLLLLYLKFRHGDLGYSGLILAVYLPGPFSLYLISEFIGKGIYPQREKINPS